MSVKYRQSINTRRRQRLALSSGSRIIERRRPTSKDKEKSDHGWMYDYEVGVGEWKSRGSRS